MLGLSLYPCRTYWLIICVHFCFTWQPSSFCGWLKHASFSNFLVLTFLLKSNQKVLCEREWKKTEVRREVDMPPPPTMPPPPRNVSLQFSTWMSTINLYYSDLFLQYLFVLPQNIGIKTEARIYQLTNWIGKKLNSYLTESTAYLTEWLLFLPLCLDFPTRQHITTVCIHDVPSENADTGFVYATEN